MGLEEVGVILTVAQLSKFQSDVKSAGRSVDDFTDNVDKGGKGLGGFGSKLTGVIGDTLKWAAGLTAVGTAIGGAFAATALDKYSDFSKVLADAGATSGLAGDQLKDFQDKAYNLSLKLGKDLPVSASDAAEALLSLTKAGFSGDQALAAVEGTAKLATAAHLKMGDAADIVSASINQFGLAATDSNKVVDVLAKTANASAVDVGDLSESLKYAGPVAKAAGFSFEDVNKALAVMGNAGIKGSDAGTGLRTVLQQLVSPGDKAAGIFHDLGFSSTDATGKIKPLQQQLVELREKFSGLSQAEQIDAAKAIAGQNHFSKLLAIMDASPESFQAVSTAIDNANGTADLLSDTFMHTLAGSSENLKGSFETLQITLGHALAPAMMQVNLALADFSNTVTDWITQYGPALTASLAMVWDWLQKQLIPVIVNVASTIFPMLWQAAQVVAQYVVTTLVPAFASLVDWVIKNVIPVIVDFAKTVIPALWQAFQLVVNFIINNVIPALGQLWNWAKTNIIPIFVAIGQTIQTTVIPAVQNFGRWFANDLLPKLGDVWAFIQKNIIPILEKLANFIATTLVPFIGQLVDVILNTVIPILSQWWSVLATVLGPIIEAVAGFIMNVLIPAVTTIVKYISENVIPNFRDFANFISQNVMPVLMTIGKFVGEVLVANFNALVTGVSNAWNLIVGIIGGAWNIISGVFNAITGAIGTVASWFTWLWNQLGTGWNAITGVFGGIGNFLKGVFQGAINFLIDGINVIPNVLNGLFNALKNAPVIGGAFGWLPNIGNIPHVALAQGGIVTGPTHALVGESGPEAVLPLSQLGDILTHAFTTALQSVPMNAGQIYNQYQMGQMSNNSSYAPQYNLSVQTMQSTGNVVSDFHTLRLLA